MESLIPVNRMRTRRGHAKSRTGCTNCKRRKVKCDETHPACFHCKRLDIPCSLAETESVGATAPRSEDRHIPLHSANAQPLSWLQSIAPSLRPYAQHGETLAHTSSPSGDESTPLAHLAPFPPDELFRHGFELMHHYCTVTADTLSIRKDITYVWQVAVPREGYKYSFVSYGVLALAAAHKAHLVGNGSNGEMYLKLCDYYSVLASEGFRHELQNLTEDNWMALFGFASVLILYSFSLPARSMPRKVDDPIARFLELCSIVRGIKSSLSSVVPRIYNSDFAPLVYGVWPVESNGPLSGYPSLDRTFLPHDLWDATKRLRAFQEVEVPLVNREQYQNAVDNLENSARLLARAGIYAESGAIIIWLYEIDNVILVDMTTCKPYALVLLAYYCVFVAGLQKNFWYASGWAKQLFERVEIALRDLPRFSPWLDWPRAHIFPA